ncbi:hypothetical protein EV194_11648 [Natronoflexus pectinivorans]|uniref:Uncharacterized protein n=1 Tax=Natronoflexus pectinivorans TaxID=682526 RepID=A0A4R2GBU4_9BACT|nr:hypothetical protein EV194_11648 [Natronoflexus pectinivorans]
MATRFSLLWILKFFTGMILIDFAICFRDLLEKLELLAPIFAFNKMHSLE